MSASKFSGLNPYFPLTLSLPPLPQVIVIVRVKYWLGSRYFRMMSSAENFRVKKWVTLFPYSVIGAWKKTTGGRSFFALVDETKWRSESLEPFINFLAFVVRTLWPKVNKLISEYPRELANFHRCKIFHKFFSSQYFHLKFVRMM